MPRAPSQPAPSPQPEAGGLRENAWLAWVRRQAGAAPPPGLRLGMGDDAAILRPRAGWEIAVTTDLMAEGVHFRRGLDRPDDCGYRLAMRGLSDLAAMGAAPWALFFSALWPDAAPPAWRRAVHRGLTQACRESGAALAGGDVSRGRLASFDIVALGQLPRGQALRREGARAGDRILVSGKLGLAAWGRQMLERGLQPRTQETRAALRRCRRPRARWELGQRLRGIASAAMDLSDGLSSDLDRLCAASGVRARLAAAGLPLPGPAGMRQTLMDFALHGGEDYELLFTVSPRRLPRLQRLRQAGFEIWEIGEILPPRRHGARVSLSREDGKLEALPPRGWDPWSRDNIDRKI